MTARIVAMRSTRAVMIAAVLSGATTAFAQTPVSSAKSPATGRNIEVAVGATFLTPVPMGSQGVVLTSFTASTLTVGSVTTAQTSSRIGPSFGLEARLGFRLTGRLAAEVSGGWSRVNFETDVTGDTEFTTPTSGAASITASLPLSRFAVGGGVLFRITQQTRRQVFAVAAVSWLREAADLAAGGFYEDGSLTEGGAGMKWWLRERPKGRLKRIGLRIEGRVGVRTGGISLDTKNVHIVPVIFGGLIIGS